MRYSFDSYSWAEEFIYGIEKDYRLVKTAKVACFLNGDGLANLIHADGLDNFEESSDYEKLLKRTTEGDKRNNHQFDVIVANPPYSVSAFKNTLKNGKGSFDLYDRLTDDSSEIECLFIERTKQLLKEGGYAGIVLPSSILSNGGIYADTREIILKYFDIVGIAEFGSNTFMATGTNTVTLFLRKRNESHWNRVKEIIDRFMSNPIAQADMTCNGIENAFSIYCDSIYEDLNFSDYKALLSMVITEDIESSEMFRDYNSLFRKSAEYKNLISQKFFNEYSKEDKTGAINNKLVQFIREREEEKILYFMLSYNKKVVLIKSGEKQGEKDFLGYEFSNRRGHEGMRLNLDSKGKPTTKLYDIENLLNEEKANSYIHRSFLGEIILDKDIPETLRENVYIKDLHEMISLEKVDFTKEVSLIVKKKSKLETQWDLVALGDLCNIKIGGTPSRSEKQFYDQGENLWVSISEMNSNVILDTKEKINDIGVKKSNVKLIKAGTTLLSFKLSIGKTAIAGKDLYTNEAIAALEIKDKRKLLDNYLFYLFDSKVIDLDNTDFKAFGKSLNSATLKLVKIPVPSLEVQREIINDIENRIKDRKVVEDQIQILQSKIVEVFNEYDSQKKSISELCETTSGGTPLTSKKEFYMGGTIPWLKSGEVRTGKIYKAESFISQEGLKNSSAKYIPEDSVLIAMYGATAGQIGLLKFKATTNQAVCALLPNNKYLPEYLFHYLKDKTNELLNLTIGTAQKNLSQSIIGNYKVPVPSIKIQKEIVEKINVIESNIELLKESLNKAKEKELNVIKSYL
jgi:type I restriction enzyme M protein